MTQRAWQDYPSWEEGIQSGFFASDAVRADKSDGKDLPRPGRALSRRSSRIHELRERLQWLSSNRDDELTTPSARATEAAEQFIYEVAEDCLAFKLHIGSSGEINIFYGSDADPIQIVFGDDGLVTYYGACCGEEFAGSDIQVSQFPHMPLLRFVARNK